MPIQPADLTQLTLLASGTETEVYKAQDPEDRAVLLKRFLLKRAGDWKELELFEREAKVLEQLDHPRIPRLLAYGQDEQSLYLITPWIAGESLAERIARGVLSSESEVVALGGQLLEILIWLHGHQPPVIHRDIKPSNLILNAQNELFLIDFGSVGLGLNSESSSTVAGTFGYMAPEQFSGRALPASDIYSTAATLLHLLSGKSPAEMPQERLRLNFEPYLSCSQDLLHWLQRALNPVPEERFGNARLALTQLLHADQGQAVSGHRLPAGLRRLAEAAQQQIPIGEKDRQIVVKPTEAGLELILPPQQSIPGSELRAYLLRHGALNLLLLLGLPALGLAPLLMWSLGGSVSLGALDGWRLRRRHQLQTHLLFEVDMLDIEERLDELTERRLSIPWKDVSHLEQEAGDKHLGRCVLTYTNPAGRACRYRIGTLLTYQEQLWLQEKLQTWQKQALQGDDNQESTEV